MRLSPYLHETRAWCTLGGSVTCTKQRMFSVFQCRNYRMEDNVAVTLFWKVLGGTINCKPSQYVLKKFLRVFTHPSSSINMYME